MNDAWNRLRPILRPGEQIYWVGQPDPRIHFTSADALLVPFSLMWGGFALVWETQAILKGAPIFFILWGVPFVLIGLYLIAGRFYVKRRRKLRTVYGLTNSRAIVSSSERSFDETPIKDASMRVNRSRNGRHVNVVFGTPRQASYQNTGLDLFSLGQGQVVAFYDVDDADALVSALDRAK
ncbi:PH domain-containing protein [Arthrobacter crusticola]|uniref:PH domain-containing protein n=1 Tax=Arthrobacter crusticola TaxID=2547960 RepID=A0A4V3ALR8_9MICC|nr:PH domain-containing protein [Arthrobacter crusticola]TDK24076.1 PH domain-containing protein [Arthrobacter crusticola]